MHDLLHQQDSSRVKIDEELLDVNILLYQLLLHQELFIVLHLAVLRDGGVAVELQLVVTVLRLARLVVGVLVGVVVGQGHLAEILLRGVGHGARLEVRFGRVLQGGDQLEPHVRENRVGNVNDGRKRTAKTSLAALHSSPPGSPCCPLNRRDGWWPHPDPAAQACSWPSTPWRQPRQPRRSPSPLCPRPARPRRWCAQSLLPTQGFRHCRTRWDCSPHLHRLQAAPSLQTSGRQQAEHWQSRTQGRAWWQQSPWET